MLHCFRDLICRQAPTLWPWLVDLIVIGNDHSVWQELPLCSDDIEFFFGIGFAGENQKLYCMCSVIGFCKQIKPLFKESSCFGEPLLGVQIWWPFLLVGLADIATAEVWYVLGQALAWQGYYYLATSCFLPAPLACLFQLYCTPCTFCAGALALERSNPPGHY